MSTCRSCSAPIEWAITQYGKRMPLDLGAHPDGRVTVVGRTADRTAWLVVALGADDLERARQLGELELRRAHFQTCPDADTWRRR